ncbi:hypothetical protein [Acinetobacter sp. ANC 5414]|uniref:hypothetical protein n=1 Tax=Acinetobacter sp. ANC 5414 TaxID=2731251 RepID=UPI0014904300|nr:hypothetical protein [Acinetobacter sp. ANC 5414]NNH00961.1 hypothetical protein [Acinetobacter sp. ANC 5414]
MLISNNSESSSFKKLFFFTLILISIFLILINYFVIPHLEIKSEKTIEILTSIINNLISLSITSIGASIAYLIFIPRKLKESELRVLNPNDLKNKFKSLINNTFYLNYAGHTARWNRSKSLDSLIQEAENEKISKEVQFLILDPSNDKVCEYYCSFGHSNRNKGNSINTLKDIKIELISTILICLIKNSSPFVNIKIYLSNSVSLFRFDIIEHGCILTKPYSDEPALYFSYGSFFYKSYSDEFRIMKDQSKELKLSKNYKKIGLSDIKTILNSLGIENFDLDESDLKKITSTIKKDISPY